RRAPRSGPVRGERRGPPPRRASATPRGRRAAGPRAGGRAGGGGGGGGWRTGGRRLGGGGGGGRGRPPHHPRPPARGAPRAVAVLDDLVAQGAAAMLHDAEDAGQPVADALAAEDHDRVGGGADVAGGHLARQEVLEPRLLRGHEEHSRQRGVVVEVRVDELP